jgi:hypothetical protein
VLLLQMPRLQVLTQHHQLQMQLTLMPAACVAAGHWRLSTFSSSACSCPWLAAGLQREQGLLLRRRPVLWPVATALRCCRRQGRSLPPKVQQPWHHCRPRTPLLLLQRLLLLLPPPMLLFLVPLLLPLPLLPPRPRAAWRRAAPGPA